MVAAAHLFLVGLQYVKGKRSGECGERRACCRVGRGKQSHDEQHSHDERQGVACRHSGEKVVATLVDAHLRRKHIEQHAEHEEEQIDEELAHDAYHHVLLRVTIVLAVEVALHHVLVETSGSNHREHASKELLKEEAAVVDIVEEEHAAVLVREYGARDVGDAEVETVGDEHYAEHHRQDETQRLEHIGPYNRLHTTAEREQPHHQHGERHVKGKGQAHRFKHQQLQREAHKKQSHGGAEHL